MSWSPLSTTMSSRLGSAGMLRSAVYKSERRIRQWEPALRFGQEWVVGQQPTDGAAIGDSRVDPARFEEIFDRHFRAIHRYLARRVGSELADELAAETFAQAFRARDRYDDSRQDARPWLFGIAANLLRHHRRDEKRRFMAYARSGVDRFAPDETDHAESRADAAAAEPQIARALASMRAEQREVLLLFAWADLSYEEISAALGIPRGTVRSRLSRARKHVREGLVASGHDPRPSTSFLEPKEATSDG
jgi:RNA polymerase sigma-70 factor, ECF subfamily